MPRTKIVGILNVTPDSFYDGGRYMDRAAAVRFAGEMLQVGADILEIGGESSGPGSKEISLDEELQRTIPVIEAIRTEYPEAQISVDTWKAAVARQAVEKGAVMINDITAGRGDSAMFATIAKFKMQNAKFNIPNIVLMYSKEATARTTVDSKQYDDVVGTIVDFLVERRDAAESAGIPREKIILDPGLGHFVSSDPRYSYAIIARLPEIAALGCPLLLSPSRKSFLRGSENLPAEQRLPGTIAASAIAVLRGTAYIRTHDVAAVRRACEVAEEILAAGS